MIFANDGKFISTVLSCRYTYMVLLVLWFLLKQNTWLVSPKNIKNIILKNHEVYKRTIKPLDYTVIKMKKKNVINVKF